MLLQLEPSTISWSIQRIYLYLGWSNVYNIHSLIHCCSTVELIIFVKNKSKTNPTFPTSVHWFFVSYLMCYQEAFNVETKIYDVLTTSSEFLVTFLLPSISSYVTTIPPESPAYPFVWSETWCCPWNVLFEQFPSFWHWHTGVFVLLATHFKAGLQLIVNDLAAFLEINPTGISTNTDRVMHHTHHRSPDRYYFSTNNTGRDYFWHLFQTSF